MNTSELYSLYLQHPVVSTDSRKIPAGCLFFALKGQNFDGNKFARESLGKGAAYAVTDQPDLATDKRLIRVDDVLKSLQDLARFHRRQLKTPLIAITGTNGKTTTKELTAAVLRQKYVVTFTQGNLNNHIGVPLTLLNMTKKTELAVIEMGANHPGEIATLCTIAEPDYGLITNIGQAHLEGFGSFEGVIKTKSELYDFLRQNQGRCFINSDNELLLKQAVGLGKLTYGSHQEAQLRGFAEEGGYYLTIRALFPKGWLYLKSKLIGSYNTENVLAAARIGLHFDVDPLDIQKAVESYQPGNNRSQLMQVRNNQIIMDAYNANPTSMQAALKNFSKIKHPHKTLILGDMLELGAHSEKEHQRMADFIKNETFNLVCLVGPCFSGTDAGPKAKKFESTELLADYLEQHSPLENQFILIKGSRGMQLEKILEKL